MMIEFKTEASLWEMMAQLNPDGRSAKPFNMRRWELSDDRIYRLAWGSTGGQGHYQVGDDLLDELPWTPDEKEVAFVNKKTGEIIAFEYLGVELPSWAPGWGFLQLGRCTFLAGKRMGAEDLTDYTQNRIKGPAGSGERIPLPDPAPSPIQGATLDSWLLHLPGQSAAWSHYQLSVVHLREIEGYDPPHKRYEGAEYELMLVALNPARNPNVKDPKSFQLLTPINYAQQFHGTSDDQAKEICEMVALALVTGQLPAEVVGSFRGAKELWDKTIKDTVDHYGVGHG